MPPSPRLLFPATLLGFSGACALVYQMAWLREFRLVFGGATPATAAVLAIFMGMMGAGSALFGRRVERCVNPLRLYALIELGVGVAALLTPLLLGIVRTLYLGTGGIAALGQWPATLLQLLLATVVLAPACLLMGGSLPAAFKWVETDQDQQRGRLGVLYGINTLGALAGVLLSTFWLLEHWGIHRTVMAAAGVNLIIGAVAWWASRKAVPATRFTASTVSSPAKAPPRFIYLAAGITGFTFFLSELVWFRMLAPLLGSSVYGFGLILALALAGIGLGGLLYRAAWASRSGAVSLASLAQVTAWQALFLVIPWALGDRIALFAIDLSQWRASGFFGQVCSWTLISSLLVLVPALIAGVQFPLLVGLLGSGTRDAGRHTGNAYAANTLGAITGSLAGGFLLLPWLTAPGAWRLVVVLTLLLSLSAAMQAARRGWLLLITLWTSILCLMIMPMGPTAAWRHKAIGYGRVEPLPDSVNGLRAWLNASRWKVAQQFEGREASVAAVTSNEGYCLYVNGKSDGSAFGDADTQVMLGLVPAMLHQGPRSAFVVGLGTGSTAGWLAAVPDMKQVDVAELEPGMSGLARQQFAPVNRDVMTRKNVRLIVGDARESLLAQGSSYDLIVSEPSNPYRAGVATLFTQEFYHAVKGRLAAGGLFAQWLQGYEVDSHAIHQVYATLSAVFPHLETWVTGPNDLLFIGHLTPPAYSLDQLRARVTQPPFDEALKRVWFTRSAEGVLAHHLASPDYARHLATTHPALINTDDRNLLEYGFARSLSGGKDFDTMQVLTQSTGMKADVPAHLAHQVDRARLTQERLIMLAADDSGFSIPLTVAGDDRRRAEALEAFSNQLPDEVLATWTGAPGSPFEQLMLLESASHSGTPYHLRPLLEAVRQDWPANALFASAQSAARHESAEAAVKHLLSGFAALRQQVWMRVPTLQSALSLVPALTAAHPEFAPLFLDALKQPFPGGLGDVSRMSTLVEISPLLPENRQTELVSLFEPNPPWMREFLEFRVKAYQRAAHPLARMAEQDLHEFLIHVPESLDETGAATR